jgi:3-methyladenine DNA glycosylase AlkD
MVELVPLPRMNTRLAATVILASLRGQRSERDIAGQRRFGITPRTEHLGLSLAVLRPLARQHRNNHALALALWDTGVHDVRLLAVLVDDAAQLTGAQMDRWARAFDSWALVDGACIHLFRKSPLALTKARHWMRRRDEFVRRAGFVLAATLAVHAKDLPDAVFLALLPELRRGAADERHFVKMAVNWALRQIGKRNPRLRRAAITEARRIFALDTSAARWIARDALRELRVSGAAARARG